MSHFSPLSGAVRRRRAALLRAAATSALVAFAMASAARAQPVGGNVVAGQAAITSPNINTTIIEQASQKAIINWQSFSVGAAGTVEFKQPDSAALTLNRVTGATASSIEGAIKSNGQVWLINPNGVLFGPGATVNVGGLLATTADLANNDFLSGRYEFSGSPSGSAVVNQGAIQAASGGSVVLSASRVVNKGVIVANSGHVVLGGAQAFTVDFNGDKLLSYAVTAPAKGADAGVSNEGVIKAAGGKVLLTARAADRIADGVVNNSGMIEASSARVENGEVILDAGDGSVTDSGSIDASGKGTGESGGTVKLLGKSVAVADGAHIDVSGDTGGGSALVGGNLHGAGPEQNAQTVTVGKATIKADAITRGHGGTVAVYSTGTTQVAAAISAQGGTSGGDGGMVETSGHDLRVDDATTVTTAAVRGTAGDWLLDPGTINIASLNADTTLDGSNNYTLADDTSTTDTKTIAPSTITTALQGGSNVTLEATSAINVNEDLVYNSNNTLMLLSKGSITLNAQIQNNSAGDISLVAGWDGTTHATGLYAAGNYGLTSGGTITLQGSNADVGSGGGATYLSAYGLSLHNGSSNTSYAQVGYRSGAGGNIYIETLAGGVNLSENYGGTAQIGNGRYDVPINGAVTGNITITTTGPTTVTTYSGKASIGNYTSSNIGSETGNVTITTATLADGNPGNSVPYNLNNLIIANVGTSSTGGDVSVTITDPSTVTNLALNYSSPHNVNIYAAYDLNVGATSYGGTGNLTLTAGNYVVVSGAVTGSGSGRLSLLAQGNVYVNSTVQNSSSGDLVVVSGWDHNSYPTGLSAPGSYGLTGDTTSIGTAGGGNASLGSHGGNVYVSANALTLQDADNLSYAQVGYHGTGGGNIAIQTLGGNINLSEGYGGTGTTQIGNGSYNSALSGLITGDISIAAAPQLTGGNGIIIVSNAGGHSAIGNYGSTAVIGNVAITAADLTSTGTAYDANTLINGDIVGASGNGGGNVSLTLTAAASPIALNFSVSSGNSISVITNNALTLGAISNDGGGGLTLSSGQGDIAGTSAVTMGALNVTAQAGIVNFGAYSNHIAGTFSASSYGSVSSETPAISLYNAQALTLGTITAGNLGGTADYGAITISTSSDMVAGVLDGGAITLSAGGNLGQSGPLTSHHSLDNTTAGSLAMTATEGYIAMSGTHVIEPAVNNGTITDTGQLRLNAFSSVSANFVSPLALYQASAGTTLSLSTSGTTPTVPGYNGITINAPVIAGGDINLTADGDIIQAVSGSADVHIATPGGLLVSSTGGNLVLNDSGYINATENPSDTGNNITGYAVLNAGSTVGGTGNASFANSTRTVLGGPIGQPGGNSPQSVIGGSLTVEVNDRNQPDGGDLILAGTIITQQSDATGITTLHAKGSLDNNNGNGTILAQNLSLVSDTGAVGGDDGTHWSFGLGSVINETLNLHAEAATNININPGNLNIGVTALTNGGLVTPNDSNTHYVTIFGNGTITQNGDASGALNISGNLDVHAANNIMLDNAANAVTVVNPGVPNVTLRAQTFGFGADITFVNSVNTIIAQASGGLNGDGNVISASSVNITVHDPSGETTPSLTFLTGTDYYMSQPRVISINASGTVSLQADGMITDGFVPGQTSYAVAPGFITAGGVLSMTSSASGVSLLNPANNVAYLGTALSDATSITANQDIGYVNSQTVHLQAASNYGTISVTTNDANNGGTHSRIDVFQAIAFAGSNTSLLHASGDITMDHDELAQLSANGIALVSDSGSIGSSNAPVNLTPGNQGFQLVQATAANDIYLTSGQGFALANLALTDPASGNPIGSGALAAGGHADVQITGPGDIFQGNETADAITAASLTVVNTNGYVTLTNPVNAITGEISLASPGVSSLVNSTDTLLVSSGGGALSVQSGGNLTIANGATLSASQSGNGTILLAAANAFINNAGPNALSLAYGGSFQIFSQNPSLDTFNGLDSGNTAVFSTSYAGTPLNQSGNRYVFADAQAPLIVAATNLYKTYGDDATSAVAAGYTVSGGDTGVANAYQGSASFSGTPSVTSSGAGANADVNDYTISVSQGSFSSSNSVSFQDATLTVGQRMLTTALQGSVSKIYDGTASATLDASNYSTLSGVVNGDTVALANFTGGTYGDANAGGNKTVTVTGLSLSGARAGNYTVASTLSDSIGTIQQKALTTALQGTVSKTYDATTSATLASGNYGVLNGVVGGDDVSLVPVFGGSYADANAGTGKAVNVNGLSLGGSAAGNYTIASGLSGNVGVIQQKALTTALQGTVSKTYDATTSATLAQGNYAALTGVVNGDDVSLAAVTSGAYGNADAGSGKTVNVTGLSLAGAKAGNYTIASSISGTIGVIGQKTVSVTLQGTATKVYDGTTGASFVAGNFTPLSGVLNNDSVTLLLAQGGFTGGSYASADAGSGKAVTATGLALGGASAGNYTIASSIGGTIGVIQTKLLSVALQGAVTKTYDATTSAALTLGNYTALNGVVNNDDVSLATFTSGAFADANAGSGKTVTTINLSLSGAKAGNYAIASSVSGSVGVINPKLLTVALQGAVTKTYDATTGATLTAANYSALSGVISGDAVSLVPVSSGTYVNAEAGTGKTVSVSGLALSGSKAGNYTIASGLIGNIGVITQKLLTVSLQGAASKIYDGTASATLTSANYSTLSGIIGSDAVTLVPVASGTYGDADAGTGKGIFVTGLRLSGAKANDYAIASGLSGDIGIITQKLLTVSLQGATFKTYDGTANATLTAANYGALSGVVGNDSVILVPVTAGTYGDADAGAGKTVSVTGLSLNGGNVNNYAIASGVSANIGTITQKLLTVSLQGTTSKTYDGTTSALLTAANYSALSGVIGGDAVGLVPVTNGTYGDAEAGTGKTVSVSGLALSGSKAGNYTIASGAIGNIGVITQKLLTVSLQGAASKTYDGTASATLTSANYSALSGIIGNDAVSLVQAVNGIYADADAGTGKTVSVSGLALSGAKAGNYTVAANVSGAIGVIGQKLLTVSLQGTASKTYDGTTSATLTSANYGALSGVVGSDAVSLVPVTGGSYADAEAGTGKAVSVSGLVLSGAKAGNYAIASSVSGSVGAILQKTLTVSLQGDVTKTYDGTTTATLTSANYSALSGVIGGDAVGLVPVTGGTYGDADVGTAKSITVTGLALAGVKAGDYAIASSIVSNIGVILAAAQTAQTTPTAATVAASAPLQTFVASQTAVSNPVQPAAFLTITNSAPPQTTIAPAPATQVASLTPAQSSPLADLVSNNSGGGNNNNDGPPEPPSPAEKTSDSLAQSLDSGGSSSSSAVVIPTLLNVARPPPPAGANVNELSGWGNSVLWQ